MPARTSHIAATDAPPPLETIRARLAMAEADLNGICARIGAGHLDHGPAGTDPVTLARRLTRRVYQLRHDLDVARLACLRVESLNGRPLESNDEDDMGDALHHALDRLRLGDDDEAAFRAPVHAADKARGL